MIKRVVLEPFGKDTFRLKEDYEVFLIVDNKAFFCLIKKGFITNGANIPRLFWSIYPPNSPAYLTAVVIHDYLCINAKNKKDKSIADKVFKQALKELKINAFTRNLFYLATRGYHLTFGRKCNAKL